MWYTNRDFCSINVHNFFKIFFVEKLKVTHLKKNHLLLKYTPLDAVSMCVVNMFYYVISIYDSGV